MGSVLKWPVIGIRFKNIEVKCKSSFKISRNELLFSFYFFRTADLDEILQIHSVFLNVSKGQIAKESDLTAAFGINNVDKIILEILERGEVQVGSEERGEQLKMLTREVATIVSDKCVNPATRTPYPIGVIEQAMAELHFSPNLTKSAKQQGLEIIKQLEQGRVLPIARAQMKLAIEIPATQSSEAIEKIKPLLAMIESERLDEKSWTVTCFINPGQYRSLMELTNIPPFRGGKLLVRILSLRDFQDPSPSSSTSTVRK